MHLVGTNATHAASEPGREPPGSAVPDPDARNEHELLKYEQCAAAHAVCPELGHGRAISSHDQCIWGSNGDGLAEQPDDDESAAAAYGADDGPAVRLPTATAATNDDEPANGGSYGASADVATDEQHDDATELSELAAALAVYGRTCVADPLRALQSHQQRSEHAEKDSGRGLPQRDP